MCTQYLSHVPQGVFQHYTPVQGPVREQALVGSPLYLWLCRHTVRGQADQSRMMQAVVALWIKTSDLVEEWESAVAENQHSRGDGDRLAGIGCDAVSEGGPEYTLKGAAPWPPRASILLGNAVSIDKCAPSPCGAH